MLAPFQLVLMAVKNLIYFDNISFQKMFVKYSILISHSRVVKQYFAAGRRK